MMIINGIAFIHAGGSKRFALKSAVQTGSCDDVERLARSATVNDLNAAMKVAAPSSEIMSALQLGISQQLTEAAIAYGQGTEIARPLFEQLLEIASPATIQIARMRYLLFHLKPKNPDLAMTVADIMGGKIGAESLATIITKIQEQSAAMEPVPFLITRSTGSLKRSKKKGSSRGSLRKSQSSVKS